MAHPAHLIRMRKDDDDVSMKNNSNVTDKNNEEHENPQISNDDSNVSIIFTFYFILF